MNRSAGLIAAAASTLLASVSMPGAQTPGGAPGPAGAIDGPTVGLPDLPGAPVGPATGDQLPIVAADFIALAAVSDLFEINASRLVVERAPSGPVKAAAEMLFAAHTLAARIFPTVIEQAGLAMSTTPTLTSELEAMLDQLTAAAPEALERLYVEQQIIAHQNAIAGFTTYATSGDNETLRAYAQMMLPALQSHLAMIQTL